MIATCENNGFDLFERYRDRNYEAGTGRFVQEDTDPGQMSFAPSVIQKYAYGLNNPSRYIDPSGRIPLLAIILVGALIGGTVNALTGPSSKFAENFLIGAAAGAAAAAVGAGVAAILGSAGGIFGAVANGALIGAATGATSTTVNLLLSGEDITSKRNRGKILMSAAIGALIGATFAGWSYQRPTLVQQATENLTKVNGEVIDTAGKKTIDYIYDMKTIECLPFKNFPDNSYQRCMGTP